MLAVAAAYLLRMVLLWLSHHRENLSSPRFETVGLEAHLVASSLAGGKGFFGPYPRYQALTACLAPVYPFLWAIGEKLFHLNFYRSTVFGQVMNCVFSAATCWPIFGIGKRVFSRRIGLASAWVWVFLPYAVLFPLEWTWDQSLSALMLALIIFATLRLGESGPLPSLTGYGLLWALAALVNPTLCILLPFLLGWLMVRRGQVGWLSLASAAKVIFVFVLALLPWTVRNYYAIDGLVFVKSDFGMELWLGNNPEVKEIYTPERHPVNNRGELISLILNGEPNYNREKQRQAIAFIETHPRVFLRNVFDRFEDTWSATYDSRVEPWILTLHLSRMDVWFCLVFSMLSFVGMILALPANWQDALPLAMCLLVFPMPYYITHTALRYRHPIDPFMTIFTVYAIARLWSTFTAPPDRDLALEESSRRES
jgi:4-amino-4-deoxy-L-arabinose transferase-like glycosyltransferase